MPGAGGEAAADAVEGRDAAGGGGRADAEGGRALQGAVLGPWGAGVGRACSRAVPPHPCLLLSPRRNADAGVVLPV